MDCTEVKTLMLDARRGLLASVDAEGVRAHLRECASCRQADAEDAELSQALTRLRRRPAPAQLRADLDARFGGARTRTRRAAQGAAFVLTVASLAAGAALFVRAQDRESVMFAEAMNDHLRVLYSERPVEIESGGVHQVKPWFTGRLDFAPKLAFGGDDDFPLRGGAIAYFIDRKAAAFLFSRRLHAITLLVFRADGLPWPGPVGTAGEPLGAHRVFARESHGFHELLWVDGDLGYALVSDVAMPELRDLAMRIESAK